MNGFNRYLAATAALFAAAAINSAAFSQAPGKSVWDGVYADAQSKRGEEVSKKSCVTCHGDELAGQRSRAGAEGRRLQGSMVRQDGR